MESLEIIAAIGILVGLLSFFAGRILAAKAEGKQKGALISETKHLLSDVQEIDKTRTELRKENAELKERLTRIETRINLLRNTDM